MVMLRVEQPEKTEGFKRRHRVNRGCGLTSLGGDVDAMCFDSNEDGS